MPTLTAIRRHLAAFPALGYQLITAGVQTSPPSGSYAGTATGADAARTIVTTDLASQIVSGSGEGAGGSYLNNVYAYVLSATPEQRRVAENGYTSNATASDVASTGGSTIVATILLDRVLGATPPAGTVVELHPKCPVLNDGFMAGMHWCINKALGAMRLVDTLTIAGTGARTISLASYPITQEAQIGGIYTPAASTASLRTPFGGGNGTLRFDGESVLLDLPAVLASGQSVEVDIVRPRSSWIKVGSTWGASTVGLVNETDECTGDINHIALVAYYWVCSILAQRSPLAERKPWSDERDAAAIIAQPFMTFGQPILPSPASAPGDIMGDSVAFLRQRGGYGNGFGGGWP